VTVFRCECGYVNDLPQTGFEAAVRRCGGCGRSLVYTSEENDERIYREIRTAALRRYIPGQYLIVAFLLIVVGFFASQPQSRQVVGWDGEWSFFRLVRVVLWFLGVLLTNVLVSTVSVSVLYWWQTGRMYVEDRVAFTRAGALDLSHATPLVSPLLVYWYFWATSRGAIDIPLPDSARSPLAFWGLSLGVTLLICSVLSLVLFKLLRPKFRRRSL
jgi:hypothetical protein